MKKFDWRSIKRCMMFRVGIILAVFVIVIVTLAFLQLDVIETTLLLAPLILIALCVVVLTCVFFSGMEAIEDDSQP